MSAKDTADRYISQGGRIPGKSNPVDDIMVLGSFMAWWPKNEYRGGYRAEEAWLAMCRLLDLHPVEFRGAIMGDEKP